MVDCIEGHRRRLKREKDKREAEAKDQISMLYIQALQIGNVLSHMFDDKVAIKPLSAYYPGLKRTISPSRKMGIRKNSHLRWSSIRQIWMITFSGITEQSLKSEVK